MNRHQFHEAHCTYSVIEKITDRIQFWHKLKDEKEKSIGNVTLSENVSHKLDTIINEIIKEHEVEIERLYQIIEKL